MEKHIRKVESGALVVWNRMYYTFSKKIAWKLPFIRHFLEKKV